VATIFCGTFQRTTQDLAFLPGVVKQASLNHSSFNLLPRQFLSEMEASAATLRSGTTSFAKAPNHALGRTDKRHPLTWTGKTGWKPILHCSAEPRARPVLKRQTASTHVDREDRLEAYPTLFFWASSASRSQTPGHPRRWLEPRPDSSKLPASSGRQVRRPATP
jgi:hypothetical protein